MKMHVQLLITIQVLMLLFSVTPEPVFGQQPDTAWVRIWDNMIWEEGRDIVTDDSNNVYVAGWTYVWGANFDFVFGKYNANGVLQWMKVRDYTSGDQATKIKIGPDGYVYAGGFVNGDYSTTGGNLCVMKYSTNGDSIWEYYDQNFSVAQLTDLQFDQDGNIIVSGFVSSSGSQEFILTKLDTAGQQLWQKSFNNNGPNQTNRLTGCCIDAFNNIYITGTCDDAVNFYTDIITIKYNAAGDTLWKRQFNGPGNNYDASGKIIVGINGEIYTAGQVETTGPVQTDYVLLHYDTAGNLIFSKYFNYPGPQSFDVFRDLQSDSDGNIYLLGNSSTNNAQNTIRVQLIKYNLNGDTIWTAHWGTGSDYAPQELLIDQQSNLYICGAYYDYLTNTGYNAFIISYDSSGVLKWETTYHDTTNQEEEFFAMCLDGNNDLIATGRQHAATSIFDLSVVKYLNSVSGLSPVETDAMKISIQCYPNPLGSTGWIQFFVPDAKPAEISMYDLQGKKIAELERGTFSAGTHTMQFNPGKTAPGIYLIRIQQEQSTSTTKVIISQQE